MRIPWGGIGLNFSRKMKLVRNNWNIHESTQFSMLIPNLGSVLTKNANYLTRKCLLLIKIEQKTYFNTMRSRISLVAMFSKLSQIYHFVAREKGYRMSYTRSLVFSVFITKYSLKDTSASSFIISAHQYIRFTPQWIKQSVDNSHIRLKPHQRAVRY